MAPRDVDAMARAAEVLLAAGASRGAMVLYRRLLDEHTADAAFNRDVIRALMSMTLPIASRAPTLVAVGSRETFAAKGAARQLVRALPDARGVVAPDLGHVWNLQDAALFTAMIRAWVHARPLPERLRPLAR